VNIDLMFSLPGQSLAQWEHTLNAALRLQPDHISSYNLSYEEDTDFFQRYGAGAGNEETDVAMFNLADDMLSAAGYRHYEISNYALPGCESRHNLACWHGEDYCGLGPGACGTMNGTRYCNSGDTAAYTAALLSGLLPPGTAEQLDPATRRTELLGLLLRTDEGLPAHMLRPQDAAFTAMLQQEGLASLSPAGHLVLTRAGRLVADEIAVGLI
jgi:oxygen-independent coproporphyrinogen-3 oxidase